MQLFGKYKYWSLFSLILVVGVFVYGYSAQAGVFEDVILSIVGVVIAMIINVLGLLVTILLRAIIFISKYNNFAQSAPVVLGWTIIRDLCNMFFILIVLVIAFATILHFEKYSIKNLLVKVIVMAILINFSKLICAVIIEGANVIMMTFVAGFESKGAEGMSQALGIDKMQTLSNIPSGTNTNLVNPQTKVGTGSTFWDVLLLYILALVYMLVATVVLLAMCGVLLMRMIFIWIYIVLSPLAYLASTMPATESMARDWWTKFTSYVMTGPILAFFIWLSLAVLSGTTGGDPDAVTVNMMGSNANGTSKAVANSQITTTNFFIGYAIAIGLLIGGLVVSKQYGGQVGSAAGWGLKKIQDGAGWAKKQAGNAVKFTGEKAWSGAKYGAGLAGAGVKSLDQAATGGMGSRTLGTIKDNMNRRGLAKVKDGILGMANMAIGKAKGEDRSFYETHRKANEIKQAVAKQGHWIDPNTKVKYEKNVDGYITANGKRFTGDKKSDDELKTNIEGHAVALKARGDVMADLSQGWVASAHGVKARKEREEADAKEIEKFKPDYKNYTESELAEVYHATTNVNRRRAILQQAADKGFTSEFFGKIVPDPNKDIERKAKVYDKQYQLDSSGSMNIHDNNRIADEYSDTNLDMDKFDWKDEAQVANLSKKLAMQQVMAAKGIWDQYLDTLSAENKSMAISDLSAMQRKAQEPARNNPEVKRNFQEAQALFKDHKQEGKAFGNTVVKTRADYVFELDNDVQAKAFEKLVQKGDIKLSEQKINHLDAHALSKIIKHTLKAEGRERFNADVNKVDKEGDKSYANKMADAALILAEDIEDANPDAVTDRDSKEGQEAFNWRKDNLRLKGNIGQAFSQPDGEVNLKDVAHFAKGASSKELGQIDATLLKGDAKSIDILKQIAGSITHTKLNGLQRQGDNQDLVNMIAEQMAKINHVEAPKLRESVSADINVDVDACKINDLIIKEMGKSTNPKAHEKLSDYEQINKFREDVVNIVNV
jgi:hypothetical protein